MELLSPKQWRASYPPSHPLQSLLERELGSRLSKSEVGLGKRSSPKSQKHNWKRTILKKDSCTIKGEFPEASDISNSLFHSLPLEFQDEMMTKSLTCQKRTWNSVYKRGNWHGLPLREFPHLLFRVAKKRRKEREKAKETGAPIHPRSDIATNPVFLL